MGSMLYGVAPNGGDLDSGTLFALNTNGDGFTVLHHFDGTNGANPWGGLAGSGTTLYGVTESGGAFGAGTVFKVQTDGAGFGIIKNFEAGSPNGGLLLLENTLFGTIRYGEQGIIFRINTDGSAYRTLRNFDGSEGSYPQGDLVLVGSTLYGSASGGGQGYGTLFRINTDGTGFAVIKVFNGQDGAQPGGGLTATGAVLYGTTSSGGNFGVGTVFQIGTDGGGFAILKNLSPDSGISPFCRLAVAGEVLYGTANSGGFVDSGTLFRLSPGPPVIDVQPEESVAAYPGDTVYLSVQASGYPPPDCQWFFESTNAIPGATNSMLVLTNVQFAQRGAYTVVVTNDFGSVTSRTATLTVIDPFIITQPVGQLVRAGQTAQFNVTAGGTPALSYQWVKDGVSLTDGGNILGAQAPTLTVTSVQDIDAGVVLCRHHQRLRQRDQPGRRVENLRATRE